MRFTIHVNFIVKCMGLGSNSCFMTSTTLTNDHYMMYIISSVGYPMLDLVGLLVLWMVAYNGRAQALYYKSLETVSILLRMGNILGRPYY
jgi:hypothetical protein